ncbi:MAG: phospholipase D-like domain-containing protein [Candidatus Binataceae bacterium]
MLPKYDDRQDVRALRALATSALSRAAGAALVANNHVRLLKDAQENYPAWLQAINAAEHYVHFESYIIYEDDVGQEFADALIAKAREGVRIRLIYDWMGGFRKASRRFWNRLRAGGVEVRCYNPPRFDSPFGWLSRDHRKMLVVDGRVGFITGLCVGRMWAGEPEKNIEPWRDTGVEVRGAAVSEIEQAFAHIWAMMGDPIPATELSGKHLTVAAGNMDVRIVASLPATAGMLRLDELVAALARKRLWLTDAYYAATTSYVQSLRAAARDGVDVRLLVPNATDIPILKPLSRAGYRPLLEAGVRVFEWNGSMLHAKTAVADDHWARVGSTNLNVASWFGNCELDAVIEDDSFAREMKEMYLRDLANATEIVLDARHKLLALGEPPHPHALIARRGSAGRGAAGAIRVGNTLGAAFTNRRVLEPIEARIMLGVGGALLASAILFAFLPRLLAYPLALLLAWIGMALLHRGYRLHREKK